VIRRHHNAQRLLERVIVFIPYVNHLKFPSRWLRTRRDNERFLCLIGPHRRGNALYSVDG
jgi:hypothetical protein